MIIVALLFLFDTQVLSDTLILGAGPTGLFSALQILRQVGPKKSLSPKNG
jgi:ribulose 1,5-bisphosphate synthetase/thiazole synthase